jgi:hypothetical protein
LRRQRKSYDLVFQHGGRELRLVLLHERERRFEPCDVAAVVRVLVQHDADAREPVDSGITQTQ